jgi:hypothetical protein
MLHWKRIILASIILDPAPAPSFITPQDNDRAEQKAKGNDVQNEDERLKIEQVD